MGIMEFALEMYEIRQMALPLLTIIFAILAILFFIYYGAGTAFYITAVIGLVVGFYGAWIASGSRHAPLSAPSKTVSYASAKRPKSPSRKPKRGKNK